MKKKLNNLYQSGAIDAAGLLNAVAKSWISVEDMIEIVGEDNAYLL